MPTPSESFIAQARELMRLHALDTEGWWFDARLPADEPSRMVQLESGLSLLSPVVIHVELVDQPSVDLRLEADEDEIRVTSVTIMAGGDATELTATALRLPFKRIIDEAKKRFAVFSALPQQVEGRVFLSYPGDGRIELRAGVVKDRRRRFIDDDLLRQVSQAVREGDPARPNVAVQDSLHTSPRNASRWIAEAKRRGFLNEEDDSGE
jgi:hypothetical protein